MGKQEFSNSEFIEISLASSVSDDVVVESFWELAITRCLSWSYPFNSQTNTLLFWCYRRSVLHLEGEVGDAIDSTGVVVVYKRMPAVLNPVVARFSAGVGTLAPSSRFLTTENASRRSRLLVAEATIRAVRRKRVFLIDNELFKQNVISKRKLKKHETISYLLIISFSVSLQCLLLVVMSAKCPAEKLLNKYLTFSSSTVNIFMHKYVYCYHVLTKSL